MVEGSGEKIMRSLYVYGLVGSELKNHGKDDGYDLQKPVTATLKYLFKLLEKYVETLKKPQFKDSVLINEECLIRQKAYFNLESDSEGWVSQNKDEKGFYRAQRCSDEPKERAINHSLPSDGKGGE